MFRRKRSVNKKKLEHKLYLARENPELVFDLSDCDLVQVPSGVYSLCKVFLKEIIDLRNNQLSSLSNGGDLKDLQLVKILYLQQNEFSSLPDDICLLKNLQELYLTNNEINKLPEALCSLDKLKVLVVDQNSLRKLPENLGNLKSLQHLNVSGNSHLKMMPKSLCKCTKLCEIILDCENFFYPPKNVCENGTKNILTFICEDQGVEYSFNSEIASEDTEENSSPKIKEDFSYEDKIRKLEQAKQQKIQEFLEIEKNNDIIQRQELELANASKVNREKLLAAITKQQNQFDKEITKIQQEKEYERFKLIEQLQEAENNADVAINKLLSLNKEPLAQLLEKEQLEEERLLSAVNKYNETLRKDDILTAMEDILQQETEKFKQFDRNRIETSRTILEEELETDSKLSQILVDQEIHKAELISKLQVDDDLQKAAVSTLLERGDARSWGLLQQVRLVESQLKALTHIEMDRKRLKMDKHLNDLAEKRVNLSVLLLDLLDQQKERRQQLLATLQALADQNSDSSEDFWLKQYQRLLDKLPEGLSQAQKNIDPRLAQALLMNGVIHCLPFLAKLTQSQYSTENMTEESLEEAGVTNKMDRIQIMDVLRKFSKERSLLCDNFEPSAPPIEIEEASAPPEEFIKMIDTLECVICLDFKSQIIFVPCGHLCCCSNCSVTVCECPLCRSNIERKISMMP